MKNFGEVKYIYNSLLAEGIAKNSDKEKIEFKKYVKTIKENKALKTQFDIYYNLENKVESDGWKALNYVNECLALMDKFSKKEIRDVNIKLNESEFVKNSETIINEGKAKLYSAIDTLINTSASPSTLDTIVEAKHVVVDYILNNKKETNIAEGYGLPNSVLSEIAVEKFNEAYADLSESEKEAISVLVGTNESEKEELYKKTIKECIELVNGKLAESSVDVKEKLLATKENLLNRVFSSESFVTDITKVLELKKYLSEE